MENLLFLTDTYSTEYVQNDLDIKSILAPLTDKVNITIMPDPLFSDSTSQMSLMRDIETHGVNSIEPDQSVLAHLSKQTILLVHWSPVNRKIIDATPNLKFIGTLRSGLDNIDVEYARSKGIMVQNCQGRLTNAVADLTLAFMLQANKELMNRNLCRTNGKWPVENHYQELIHRPFCMLTVGLIGFGSVAQGVAKRLAGFGTKIQAHDPGISQEIFDRLNVQRVNLDALLESSDIVSLHASLNKGNKEMMGKEQFAQMRSHSIFINTARADLVDELALIEALKKKEILGAALDVFSKEPLPPSSPLLHLDNVVLTPHIGGVFPGMIPLSLDMLTRKLENFLKLNEKSGD